MKKIGFFLPLVLLFTYCHKDHSDPMSPSSPVPPNVHVNDSLTAKWVTLPDLDSAIYGAVSLSVGGKGYVLTGSDHIYMYCVVFTSQPVDTSSGKARNRFMQFDSLTKTWSRLPDFPGGGRQNAAGFSIGNKIYIGTGVDSTGKTVSDFWQFDLTANTWARLADFPGGARGNAVGFAVNGKGYIGTGSSGSNIYKDIYEYDPAGGSWKRMADLPGSARYGAVAWSIGDVAFIESGGGDSYYHPFNDLWRFDPAANSWSRRADRPDSAFDELYNHFSGAIYPMALVLKDKAYVGFGSNAIDGANGYNNRNSLFQYDPVHDHWQRMPDAPTLYGVGAPFGFALGTKAYIGGGFWQSIYINLHGSQVVAPQRFFQFSPQ